MATLAQRLSGSYLRRTRETAGIVLPKQDTVVHTIELSADENAAQLELIEQLENHAQVEIEEGRAVGIIAKLALITRLRQAATWAGGMTLKVPRIDEFGAAIFDEFNEQVFDLYRVPEKFHQSGKMDAAYDLLEELVQDGQRVVVFSQFKQSLYEMQRRCEKSDLPIRSIEYHGDTPPEVRDEVKRNFDRSNHEESKWDAVLCHYKTGGVGLNLTAATQIIILDEEWNPGMNEQAYGRTHRIGQTEETTVHIFRVANTIDEWMEELNDDKNVLVSGFNKENDGVENKLLSVLQKKVKK
jgi:SNF2 family DNA or RNA helicase